MKIRVKFNRYGSEVFGDFSINYCVNFSVYRRSILNSYFCYPNDVHPGDVFDIEYIGRKGENDYRINFVRHDPVYPNRFFKKPIELITNEGSENNK